MDPLADLQHRLAHGDWVWHWLHDSPEWGKFTLLFISLHTEGDVVVAGLWEVWDEGTGVEDPVMFKASDPDGNRGAPNHRLQFRDVSSALEGLSVHGVTAAGFRDHGQLLGKYAEAVRARPRAKAGWSGGPVAVSDTEPSTGQGTD